MSKTSSSVDVRNGPVSPGGTEADRSMLPPHLRARREARIAAFQTLYEMDVAKHPPGAVLDRLAAEKQLPNDAIAYARELVVGVVRHKAGLDRQIQHAAPNWPLNQIAAVDRNILRVALWECLYQRSKVPVGVAIDEAVELAKLFGTESSSRFVNGVLGTLVAQEGPTLERSGSPELAQPCQQERR